MMKHSRRTCLGFYLSSLSKWGTLVPREHVDNGQSEKVFWFDVCY